MTELEQVKDILTDIANTVEMMGATAGKIKKLEREHHNVGALDAEHFAIVCAVSELRRTIAPLRARRKDAELSNGISPADGIEGLQKIAERFDRVMTDRYDKAMIREANKAAKEHKR